MLRRLYPVWIGLAVVAVLSGIGQHSSQQQATNYQPASQIFTVSPSQTTTPNQQQATSADTPTTSSVTNPSPSSIPKAPTQTPAQLAKSSPPPTTPAAPAVAPSPAPAPPVDIASESICPGQAGTANAAAVLTCLASYARTQHGLAALSANTALNDAATAKAQDMVACGYSHTACGRAFNYWFAVKGYTGNCSAENIAEGQLSIGAVFTAWMNSADHRANILNGSYRDIGAAISPSSSGNLWVMEFGGC